MHFKKPPVNPPGFPTTSIKQWKIESSETSILKLAVVELFPTLAGPKSKDLGA